MRQFTNLAKRVGPARRSGTGSGGSGRGGSWVVGTLIGVVVLAGCTNGNDSMSVAQVGGAAATRAADAPRAAGGYSESNANDNTGSSAASDAGGKTAAPERAGGTAGTAVGDIADAPDGRQVIRSASVTVRIDRTRTQDRTADDTGLAAAVAEAAVKVRSLVGADGFVAASESAGSVASISLRVPAASYETVMKALAGVGTITSSEEKAQDVSAKLVDVGSRIETMKASVTRVRALLARAEKISDVVALESELEQRESDLDSLLRQQSALSGQVALSTITVVVQGRLTGDVLTGTDEPEQRSGFLAGLGQGWDAFTNFLSGVGQVIGALLPFLPLLAILGLLAYWLIRRTRRRGAARSEVAPMPQAPTAPSVA